MGYPGEVPMHSFTCIMGFPETPLLPFRAGFSCGKAIYNERRLAADIFRLIPRNEHAAFGEMLARELRGREVVVSQSARGTNCSKEGWPTYDGK